MRIPSFLKLSANALAGLFFVIVFTGCAAIEDATGIPLRSDADRALEIQGLRGQEETSKRELDEVLLLEGYFAGEQKSRTEATEAAALNPASKGQLELLEVIAKEAATQPAKEGQNKRVPEKYETWLIDRSSLFGSDRELIEKGEKSRPHRKLEVIREDLRRAQDLRVLAKAKLQTVTTKIERLGGKGNYTDYLGMIGQGVDKAGQAQQTWQKGAGIFNWVKK